MTDDTATKELLLRIESTLKEEIGGLKTELAKFVTRMEHEAVVEHLNSNVARLERQIEKTNNDVKDQLREQRNESRETLQRVVAVASVIIMIVNMALMYFI